jgi:signal transduction histidine kinase
VLRKHVDVLRRVAGQRIELYACDVPKLGANPATQVLRIAQEALGNAVRHAGAERIEVLLHGLDEHLILQVSDDGCGFDPEGPEVRGQRLGLTSMQERATELGGTLRVSSTLGSGTTVRLEVPA